MGFDISYHPIKETEIKEWYFDVLQHQALITTIAEQYGMDDFYKEKYEQTIQIGLDTQPEDSFERSHGYYIAVIQGFLRKYYYTRGSAFSFLIEERPYFEKYIQDLKSVVAGQVPNPIGNKIKMNYSSGVYISPKQVVQLLEDYENNQQVREDLNGFFSDQRIEIFIKALEAAQQLSLGLLEATEVIEPNPMNLNESTCYSNLFNCDQEGVYLFKAAVMEQIKAVQAANHVEKPEGSDAETAVLPSSEVTDIPNSEVVIVSLSEAPIAPDPETTTVSSPETTILPGSEAAVAPDSETAEEKEKKGIWKKLFG